MSERGFPDRLSLLRMRFMARHGVLPREKEEAQAFEVDVVLHADLDPAAQGDDLEATVDYAALRDLVQAIVEGPSFDLMEALAWAIVRAVLRATEPSVVNAVEVAVRKPSALPGDLDGPEVRLMRGRSG